MEETNGSGLKIHSTPVRPKFSLTGHPTLLIYINGHNIKYVCRSTRQCSIYGAIWKQHMESDQVLLETSKLSSTHVCVVSSKYSGLSKQLM